MKSSVHTILGERYVRQLRPSLPVWRLKGPWWPGKLRREYQNKRCELLGLLLAEAESVYLHCGEDDPLDGGPKGSWHRLSETSWIVPDDVDLSQLYQWLDIGNWLLYAAPSPLPNDAITQKILKDPAALYEAVAEHHVSWLIDAFYDNDPWTVVLARE